MRFWIKKGDELYYQCSENKGTDQLRSNCKADLHLYFHLCRLLVFSCGGSYQLVIRGVATCTHIPMCVQVVAIKLRFFSEIIYSTWDYFYDFKQT